MALPVRKGYSGNPVTTTINGNINAGASSCDVISYTNWPTTYPFFAVLSPGTPSEEKVLVTGRSSNTLAITRGQDNTTASAHSSGATIYIVFTATEADEANLVASAMTTKGDLIATDGTTINRLGVGTNTHVLQADSTAANGFKWGQVVEAGIADSAVTSAKIADGTIVLGDLAAALQAFLVPTGSINAWSTNTAPTGWQLCDGTAVSRTTYAALFAVIGETYGVGDGTTTFNLPNLKGRAIVGRDSAQTEFDTLAETGGAKTHTLTSAEIPVHLHTISAYAHSVSQSDALGNHSHTIDHDHAASGSHSHTINIIDPGHSHTIDTLARNKADGTTVNRDVVSFTATETQSTRSAATGITATSDAANVDIAAFTGSSGVTNLQHGHSVGVAEHAAKDTGQTGGGGAHNNLQPYIVLNYIIKH
jgi:microcystin-dependent protein